MAADPIQHVVVLMLENRSFDHLMGCMQQFDASVDGVDPTAPPRKNTYDGVAYSQEPGAARRLANDPKHEHTNVLVQIKGGNAGFVSDYATAYPNCPDVWREAMRYHDLDSLPALHSLARDFTICDRWFSSLPGPTWPNRFFAHSGTSLGHVDMPEGLFNLHLHWYSQSTIYDRLNDAKVPWKIYYGDIPQSLLLVHQLQPRNLKNYHLLRQFYEDAAGDPLAFPAFSFIEPEYTLPGENDDHPPHDVLNADHLIASVYNAIRRNEKLWQSTLLVIVWDEHGGFYDHVVPAAAVPPDHHTGDYDFTQYGVRVPALLVSPYAPRRVCHDTFDHTSVLRYAIERWGLGPLGNRTASATSIGNALGTKNVSVGPAQIFVTAPNPPEAVARSAQRLNGNQQGLVAYSQYLATTVPQDPVRAHERTAFMMTSAQAQTDTANDHIQHLMDYHQK